MIPLALKEKLKYSDSGGYYRKPANGSLNQFQSPQLYNFTWITVVILELIHAKNPNARMGVII